MESLDHVNIDSGNLFILFVMMYAMKKVMETNTSFLLLQIRTKKY